MLFTRIFFRKTFLFRGGINLDQNNLIVSRLRNLQMNRTRMAADILKPNATGTARIGDRTHPITILHHHRHIIPPFPLRLKI